MATRIDTIDQLDNLLIRTPLMSERDLTRIAGISARNAANLCIVERDDFCH